MHKKLHILLLGLLLSFAVGASEITAGLKGYRLAVAIASMTTDASNVILNNTNEQVLKETIGEDFVKNWQTITAIGDAALLGSMTVTAFRNNSTQSAKALALWNQNKTKLEGKNPILAQKVEEIIENEDMLRGADEIGYAGDLGEALKKADILINNLTGDVKDFATNFKKIGKIEDLPDGSLVLKAENGDELCKIINGKLQITNDQIVKIQKGYRPKPSLYMSEADINSHLNLFNKHGGGFIFTLEDINDVRYKTFNPNKYLMLRTDLDELIRQYKSTGDVSILETGLGYKSGELKGKKIYVKYVEKPVVCIPSGNEGGANELWKPKGITSGGNHEAVLNNDVLYGSKTLDNPIYHGNDLENLKDIDKLN